MTALLPIAWRSLLARRARTLLTIGGIALGVGVLHAALLTSAGIDQAVDQTVASTIGRADLRVSAFQERGLSDATLAAIRETPGVTVAAPVIEQRLYLRPTVGAATTAPVMLRGIDPRLDGQVHDLIPTTGTGLSGDREALITNELSAADGLGLGSVLTLQAGGEPVSVRVVGVVRAPDAGFGVSGRGVIVPIDVARAVSPDAGLTRVDLRTASGTQPAELLAALATRITTEPYVVAAPADLRGSMRAATADFQAIMAMIAAVALFAGSVLVFNTLSLTVIERSREVGLLRAAGAANGQVVAFVLFGAVVMGLAGSLAGLIVGASLSHLVGAGINASGVAPWHQPSITLGGAGLAFFAGVLVALAAALEPAWRATRITPIEAVRLRMDPTSARRARLRWMVVVSLTVGLLGLAAWPHAAGEAAAIRALVIYAILVVATLVSPLIIAPTARVVGLPFALVLRLDERLARGSLAKDRSRTALTLGSLAVGLAMIVAVGGVAQQARAAAGSWIAGVIPGEEVVTSIRPIALDEGVAELIDEVPGVARVSPIGSFDLAFQGARMDAAAASGAALLADGRLVFVAGDRAAALAAIDAGGAVVLARSTAERLGLNVGDVMAFVGGGGASVDLRVAGIVERSLPGGAGEAVLVGWKDATDMFGLVGADFFAVRFEPDQAEAARPRVQDLAATLALQALPLDRVEGAVHDALEQVFGLLDALALIAVLIAALGIVNTLTMSVVERVRELGMLRAVGMSAGQVARMVVVEAGILGLIGGVIGIVVGSVASFIMVGWGGGFGIAWAPPWALLVISLLLGLTVSMLAAWYPARLAGRISIVRAVQFE